MKVGFDVTQAAKRKGRGIARYIRALLPELVDDQYASRLLNPSNKLYRFTNPTKTL